MQIIKTVLSDEDLEKFKEIKKRHGVMHDSEVLRICINNEYKQIQKDSCEKEASS